MARKLNHVIDAAAGRNDSTTDASRTLGVLGRRGYVKLALAGIASTVGLAGTSAGSATGERDAQVLRIEGGGGATIYDLTVSGSLSDDPQTAFDATDNISGGNAEGTVYDQVHGYQIEGDLTDIRLDGDATVYLDGQELDVNTGRDRSIRIVGTDSGTNYELTVSDGIEPEESTATLSQTVSGCNVEGSVQDNEHRYTFAGDLLDLRVDGQADIYVDGQAVELA